MLKAYRIILMFALFQSQILPYHYDEVRFQKADTARCTRLFKKEIRFSLDGKAEALGWGLAKLSLLLYCRNGQKVL